MSYKDNAFKERIIKMKKLLTKTLIFLLSITLCFGLVACGDDDGDTVQTTGFKYKIITEERDVEGSTTGEKEEYKYAVITGFEISSEDAEKIENGDYSTVVNDDVNWRELVIPETYKKGDKTYNVEKIEAAALAGHTLFTSITVGSNITSIGEGAFGGCTNLKTLSIPFVGASLDAVGTERVFAYLFGAANSGDGNTEISTKTGLRVNSNGNEIVEEEASTYYFPTSLDTVKITGGDKVPACAFYGMTTLKNIELAPSIKDIDNHAFTGCTALRSVDLSNVENVYAFAFSGCTALKSIEFGATPTLESLWHDAFAGCSNLCSSVLNDDALTTLKLPSSLKILKKSAFEACASIKTLDLSAIQVAEIEGSTFANCTKLEKITFKNGMVVKTGAFANCMKLTKEKLLGDFTFEIASFYADLQEELEQGE